MQCQLRRGAVAAKKQVKGSYSHLFTKKGTYSLHCTIHPTLMKETIVVK